MKIAPRIGPAQGVQPAAKPTPIKSEDDGTVAVDRRDVAVAIVSVAVAAAAAAAAAGHVAHQLPVDDLDLVEALHRRPRLRHEIGPDDCGEVAVRFLRQLKARKAEREIDRCPAPAGSYYVAGWSTTADEREARRTEAEQREDAAAGEKVLVIFGLGMRRPASIHSPLLGRTRSVDVPSLAERPGREQGLGHAVPITDLLAG